MMRTRLFIALFTFLCGTRSADAQTPAGAWAPEEGAAEKTAPAGPSDAQLQRAKDHFRRGVLLYQEGNYNGALAEFTRAYDAAPNYRLLYNLAQTHAERHDYVNALRDFAKYLDQGGDEIPLERRRAIERERSALLERVGTLRLDCNVDGAELIVNGESHGVIERRHSLQLNPGVNELRLQRAGHETTTRRVTLAGGDQLVVEWAMRPVSADAALLPSRVTEGRDTTPDRTGLWLSLAATTVLGGAAATFAVLTLQTDGDLDDELSQFPADSGAIEETRSRLRTYAAVTDAFSAGAALGAGAVIYFLLSGSDSSVQERGQDAARAPFNARWSISGNGVAVSGEF